MEGMRPHLRLPLVPLLLVAVVAGLASGCSSDADGGSDDGPTVVATGPHPSSNGPSDDTSAPLTDAPSSTSAGREAAVEAVCTPYSIMVDAIADAAQHGSDREQIAAAIAPVLKRFAAQVPDLDRPPGVTAQTWAGVLALAERIDALPAHPTSAEIGAVEQGLTAQERQAFKDAAAWLGTHCS